MKECLFCHTFGEDNLSENEAKVLELLWEEKESGFQKFFWRCLLGGRFENLDGGKLGVDCLAVCKGCGTTILKIQRLHRELEEVQMMLVEQIGSLQNSVKLCHGVKKGGQDSGGGEGSILWEFQEKVIAHSNRSCKLPLVYLGNLEVDWPPNSGREFSTTGGYCDSQVLVKDDPDKDEIQARMPSKRRGRPPKSMELVHAFKKPRKDHVRNPKRKRGRPRKEDSYLAEPIESASLMAQTGDDIKVSKYDDHDDIDWSPGNVDNDKIQDSPPKRGRGRPKDSRSKTKSAIVNKLKKHYKKIKTGEGPVTLRKVQYHHVFICDICNKSYVKRVAYTKHLRAHRENKIQKEDNAWEMKECPVCSSSFKSSEYYEHLLTHELDIQCDDKKPFVCPNKNCVQSFMIEENLRIHREIDHDDFNSKSFIKVKRCEVCNLCYDTSFHLLEHMKRVHKDFVTSLIYCPVCSYAFVSSEAVLTHMHSHGAVGQQICYVCKIPCGGRSKLLEHLRDEHQVTVSKSCEMCNEHFEDIYWHKAHLRSVHKKTDTLVCSFCGKVSHYIPGFMMHLRSHQRAKQCGYPCPDCSEVFQGEHTLGSHRAKVHGVSKVTCEICGKQYTSLEACKVHQKEHSKEGFHCAICDKYYGTKSRWQEHMNTKHSQERPFTCEVCGGTFKTAPSLRRHQETHELKHECHVCGRRFSRSTTLNYHMGMHTGRKYVCDFCGVEFHSIKSFRTHIKIYHTGDKPRPLPAVQKKSRRACKWWTDSEGNVIYAKSENTISAKILDKPGPSPLPKVEAFVSPQ